MIYDCDVPGNSPNVEYVDSEARAYNIWDVKVTLRNVIIMRP